MKGVKEGDERRRARRGEQTRQDDGDNQRRGSARAKGKRTKC